MSTVLFCIPLKTGHLKQFQDFVEETAAHKAEEWKAMMERYDISCVKIWMRQITHLCIMKWDPHLKKK